ncbi:oligopeptide/dipeptide ABC transporter ATP-binding protein [Neorhizobium galegae]|uniref:dipeptide ABC transporter ATP-binding protein n=1 Tax=Neorhizobium galegae TaxID=399 RepID=UPI001AE621A6|nr:ABC transporter ATP-binding protein [Neorhizobium galegae]MBP2551448.1 oligopeptide/dipeptide ABC transporter ATP-binding protein [Neorhizobium galegae]
MTAQPAAPDLGRDLLNVRDLTVAFGGKKALDAVSFEVRRGEIVGLLGESGSGKSTAAYAMLGLVKPPGKITSGTVMLNGQDLLSLPAAELRTVRGKDIGLIVQNPRASLHPMINVGAQIGNAWLAHQPKAAHEARARAVEMLRLVGINDPERRLDAFAHELSGGMAQRVLIAMALSSMPGLLIADEPTSGLDVTIQAQFLDQLWKTVRTTHSSVLLVTQEDGIVANYCDRVVVLEQGRIVDQDDTRAYFKRRRTTHHRVEASAAMPAASSDDDALPIVDVASLSKSFPISNSTKRVHAVNDVDLTIQPGEAVGLVGESGSGKSTVGRLIIKLAEADDGRLSFKGQDLRVIRGAALKKARAEMQIVLQDPYDSVDARWTIERILSEPLEIHAGLTRTRRAARIRELMALVELDESMLSRRPRDLGAGALQRVNIARSLATKPEFIILDEPTSVLAPSSRASLIALLRRLQSELGLSFLFISHDLSTISQVCDRVAVMYLGQIVEIGQTRDLFENPRHPYTRALIASHLAPDPENRRVDRENEDSLAGEIPSPVDLPEGCFLYSRCSYRVDRCQRERQVLKSDVTGRRVRCWRAQEQSDLTQDMPGARNDVFV